MDFVSAHNPAMDVSGHTRPQTSPGDVLPEPEQGVSAAPDGADDPRPVSIYDVAADPNAPVR